MQNDNNEIGEVPLTGSHALSRKRLLLGNRSGSVSRSYLDVTSIRSICSTVSSPSAFMYWLTCVVAVAASISVIAGAILPFRDDIFRCCEKRRKIENIRELDIF